MRILHLIYDHINNPWVGGGGAVRVNEIYRRLSNRHKITVVCARYPETRDYRKVNGIDFFFLGTARDNYILSVISYIINAMLFLRKRKNTFDIVIEDYATTNPIFSFLWRRDATLQLHQKEGLQHIKKYFLFGILFMLLEKLYPKFFRNTIVVSQICKDKFGLDKNVGIISNGFGENLLSGYDKEENYLLFLGRLDIDQKGLDTLGDALRYIKEQIKIIIAGSGKDEQKVRKIFRGQIASNKVQMVGFAMGQDKARLLRNCKYLILPSRYEAQGIVLLEAAACGKPVVVSDIPELMYTVEAGFGIAFKKEDSRDLADKIEFLLANEALRREMGKSARNYVKDYTWDKIALQYEDFLLKVVNDKLTLNLS